MTRNVYAYRRMRGVERLDVDVAEGEVPPYHQLTTANILDSSETLKHELTILMRC
jgi:hypothetical protein